MGYANVPKARPYNFRGRCDICIEESTQMLQMLRADISTPRQGYSK